jgi:hypothetical protein
MAMSDKEFHPAFVERYGECDLLVQPSGDGWIVCCPSQINAVAKGFHNALEAHQWVHEFYHAYEKWWRRHD